MIYLGNGLYSDSGPSLKHYGVPGMKWDRSKLKYGRQIDWSDWKSAKKYGSDSDSSSDRNNGSVTPNLPGSSRHNRRVNNTIPTPRDAAHYVRKNRHDAERKIGAIGHLENNMDGYRVSDEKAARAFAEALANGKTSKMKLALRGQNKQKGSTLEDYKYNTRRNGIRNGVARDAINERNLAARRKRASDERRLKESKGRPNTVLNQDRSLYTDTSKSWSQADKKRSQSRTIDEYYYNKIFDGNKSINDANTERGIAAGRERAKKAKESNNGNATIRTGKNTFTYDDPNKKKKKKSKVREAIDTVKSLF